MTSVAPQPQQDSRAAPSALAYTAEQAAKIIGGNCKASWLRAKARAREFPYEWIGGSYNFTRAQIDEIIALCEVPVRRAAQAAAVPAKRAPAKRAATAPSPLALGAGVTLLKARAPRKRNVA